MAGLSVSPWVDVLVPVLRRPGAARPFMDAFYASDTPPGQVTITAIADHDDHATADAWDAAGAHVHLWPGPARGTYARKVNAGYRYTAQRPRAAGWVLLLGDDARFTPGWLQALQEVAVTPDDRGRPAHVIYPGNGLLGTPGAAPDVHPLVRRAYVDVQGASWDGPGVVCHEGYDHNYVDAEMSLVAHVRGARAWAPDAVIAHLHHLARTAPVDGTYELGTSTLFQDRRLWQRRVRLYAPDAVDAVVPPRVPREDRPVRQPTPR